MKKKILAWLLTISMTASMFAAPAFAEEVDPERPETVAESVMEEEITEEISEGMLPEEIEAAAGEEISGEEVSGDEIAGEEIAGVESAEEAPAEEEVNLESDAEETVKPEAATETSTITFDLNGVCSYPITIEKEKGQAVTVPSPGIDRYGYIFWGWGRTPNATQAAYYEGDTYTEEGDAVYYAIWRLRQYPSIHFAVPQTVPIALSEGDEPMPFRFTPNDNATYIIESINTKADGDPKVELLDADGVSIGESDDVGGSRNFSLTRKLYAGEIYYIIPGSYDKTAAEYDLRVRKVEGSSFSLEKLDPKMPQELTATITAEEHLYSVLFTPVASGNYTFRSQGSKDSIITIYEEGTSYAFNDDCAVGNRNFELTVYMEAGVEYRLVFKTFNNDTGSYKVQISADCDTSGSSGQPSNVPVRIMMQPEDVTAGVNQTANFFVDALNVASYEWQYQKPGSTTWLKSNATGCKGSSISFKVTKSNSANLYRCKLTGFAGDPIYTKSVKINLIPGVRFLMQPESPAVTLGTNVKFTVQTENEAETGTAYQWYYSKDGVNWYKSAAEGNTTATLTVKAAANTAASMYRCKCLGRDGNYVNSAPASFVILASQPKNSSAAVGKTATFSLKAENAVSYQWQYSKDGITWYNSGATGSATDTISFKVTTSNRLNMYRCKIETATGIIAVTNPVTFTEGLKVVSQPQTMHAGNGDEASFWVTVNEAGCSYQWQYTKDGVKWSNSSMASGKTEHLTFTVANANKNNQFRCKITGNDGTVIYSDPAGIEGHDLYYGYVPTQFGENGLEVTFEHYVYCKICRMRAANTYEAHTWNVPAEGAACVKCGAFLYPDMHENEPVEHKVAAGSADEAKYMEFHCDHLNTRINHVLNMMIETCLDCGWTHIS